MGVSAWCSHTPSLVVDERARYVEQSSAEFHYSQSMKMCHHTQSLVVYEWVGYRLTSFNEVPLFVEHEKLVSGSRK